MKNCGERKDELIIAALLSNPTVRAAAAVCGISETQIYDRLRKPAFKEKYDQARLELLQQSTGYLQGIVGDAIRKMYEIMNDPDNAATVQLQAATAITRTQLAMTEQTDILTQLAELKKAVFPYEQ